MSYWDPDGRMGIGIDGWANAQAAIKNGFHTKKHVTSKSYYGSLNKALGGALATAAPTLPTGNTGKSYNIPSSSNHATPTPPVALTASNEAAVQAMLIVVDDVAEYLGSPRALDDCISAKLDGSGVVPVASVSHLSANAACQTTPYHDGAPAFAAALGEIALGVGSFAPIAGEGIDGYYCVDGFGLNASTGFDCPALGLPFVSSKLDDMAVGLWNRMPWNAKPRLRGVEEGPAGPRGEYDPPGTVGQVGEADCVPASCQMLTGEPQAYWRGAAGTTFDGTILSEAAEALTAHGFPSTFRSGLSVDELAAVGSPAIVGSGGHAVVVDYISDGHVFIRDPLPQGTGSSYSVSTDAFGSWWNGTAVTLNG